MFFIYDLTKNLIPYLRPNNDNDNDNDNNNDNDNDKDKDKDKLIF